MAEEKRALGAVAYNKDKMMFIARAISKCETSENSTAQCVKLSIKNRWAYTVLSYKDVETLRKNNPKSEELLNVLKTDYLPDLEGAITKAGVTKREEIRDLDMPMLKSLVYLRGSTGCSANSMKDLLRANNMHAQAKALTKEGHLQTGKMTTRMLLDFSAEECHKVVQQRSGDKSSHAYAVVALAYGYKGKDNALELTKANVQIAFLPRSRFECGIFFDGTNNNQFNTDLREDYERYMDVLARMFDGNASLNPDTWQGQLLNKTKTKDELLPLVFEELKKSIPSYAKNAKKQQQYDEGSWFFHLWQDKVSSDVDTVYAFTEERLIRSFNEIKRIEKEELNVGIVESKTDELRQKAKDEAKNLTLEKLLPDGEGSSYTGEDTNIVKLYNAYSTDTRDLKDEYHLHDCQRGKIYITGAGTYDPNRIDEHEDDAVLFGSALAICDTGVKAKVNQACKDLKVKLKGLQTAYIDTLVLDIFGFSRGAAEARHFVGSLCKGLDCTFERKITYASKKDADEKEEEFIEYELSKNGENLYSHILKEEISEKDAIIIDKIVFRFVGIFDTVPHEGLVQSNDIKDLNLKLEEGKVSSVVHLTAKDEFRYNFDLVSIFSEHTKVNGEKINNHFIEKEFFGAHSDVGGGYTDNVSELTELPTQRYNSVSETYDEKVKELIKKWNKKYHWVKGNHIEFINNIDKLENAIHEDRGRSMFSDGFYIKKYIYTRGQKNKKKVSSYHIYMYRKSVDTEYSQIPLEYMHKQAAKMVPLKALEEPKTSYKVMEPFCKASGKKLTWATQEMSEDDFRPYKTQFSHHSSTAGIAHHPNVGEENILYGKRDVYYV